MIHSFGADFDKSRPKGLGADVDESTMSGTVLQCCYVCVDYTTVNRLTELTYCLFAQYVLNTGDNYKIYSAFKALISATVISVLRCTVGT